MRPARFDHPPLAAHELLDSGEGAKLERFGEVLLARPDPQALWPQRDPGRWEAADLVFVRESDRGGRWEPGAGAAPALRGPAPEWTVAIGAARCLVRPTPFKHVGLFPEQAANWEWVAGRAGGGRARPRLLNLFGYTGVASLLAVQAGYEVTHVDASKASLNWLRDNADASGLARDAIRIVLDDALAFTRREARRGNRYEGVLLDPPHYGRGPKGETWRFEEGIAPLLAGAAEVLAERAFLVLTSYAIGTSPLAMANLLETLPGLEGGSVHAGELALPESADFAGAPARWLPAGFCARWWRD